MGKGQLENTIELAEITLADIKKLSKKQDYQPDGKNADRIFMLAEDLESYAVRIQKRV